MKKIIQSSMLTGMVCVVLCALLSSFVLRRGGHSYTISVNGKQVIQYYVATKEELPTLTISSNSQDKIAVYYNECGKIGTSRKLSIRNAQKSILKEWEFANVLDEHTPMTIAANDISNQNNLGLYYTSKEVETPQKLANLVISNNASASRQK